MKKIFLFFSLIVLFPAAIFCAASPDEDFNAPHPVISVSGAHGTTPQANIQPSSMDTRSDLVREVTPAQKPMTKAEAIIAAGDKYFRVNNFTTALKYYFYATKLEPSNIKAWKKTAFCYYQLKNHKYAYYAFNTVLKYDPSDKDANDFMDYYKTIIDNSKKHLEKRNMLDSMWRSAVLPGFGQFYNGQYAKGALYGAAFFGAVGLTIYEVADEKMKYTKYVNANENQDISYKEAQDSWNNALIWGIIAGVAYGANIYDACVNYNCDEARGVSLKIKGDAVYLAASMRW